MTNWISHSKLNFCSDRKCGELNSIDLIDPKRGEPEPKQSRAKKNEKETLAAREESLSRIKNTKLRNVCQGCGNVSRLATPPGTNSVHVVHSEVCGV